MATRKIEITKTSFPFYVDYFHAISLKEEQKDIFMANAGSVMITPFRNYDAYDVTATVINPLKEQGFLKVDGERLLVPLEGLLVVPDVVTTTRFPLVIIAHGQALGHFWVDHTGPTDTSKGHFTLTKLRERHPSLPEEELSYHGYGPLGPPIPDRGKRVPTLQDELSSNGVASFSINLNIVNDLNSRYATDVDRNSFDKQAAFEKQAVDFNQRILLIFLHLKLLRILAEEPIDLSPGNEQPIKFWDGTTFKTLSSVLANPVLDHAGLQDLRELVREKIDFTKLGFMGHSRGADAVSRLPAYFFTGATAPDPTFPVHPKVDDRIKALAMQIGRPQRDVIKCILALEPTATINEEEPGKHGYVIDNNQTMYFVVVGTHDEDVSMDPVRIYEYPECPKVMIAINGATHKLFNSVWAKNFDLEKVKEPHDEIDLEKLRELRASALSLPQHQKLLNNIAGSCFSGTLGGNPSLLLRFTKKTHLVIDLPKGFDDLQSAWKFGFPFTANTPLNLDDKETLPLQESIKGRGYDFEQELTAFFIEKNNEGTATLRILIDPNTGEKLSNFSHFSFRFAKGFDVKSGPTRPEEKNFTIRFFENDTPVGKPITGGDIENLKLRAFLAFDVTGNPRRIEYSILMQTAEIELAQHLSAIELPRITRIDINVIPDVKKSPPNSTAKVVFGTIGGTLLGGAIGISGAALYNAKHDPSEAEARKYLIVGGIGGAAVLGGGALYILKADKHAFVFNDFLMTNRQIPAGRLP
jgi:hypothetical protein